MMDEAEFWGLIDSSCAARYALGHGERDERLAQCAALKNSLDTLNQDQFNAFILAYYDKLRGAATHSLSAANHVLCDPNRESHEDFSAFRDWLISQGNAVYYQALENPDILAGIAPPFLCRFSLFRRTIWESYTSRFSKKNISLPKAPKKLAGTPWSPEDIKHNFPELLPWVKAHMRSGTPINIQSPQKTYSNNPWKIIGGVLIGFIVLGGILSAVEGEQNQSHQSGIDVPTLAEQTFASNCKKGIWFFGMGEMSFQDYQAHRALMPSELITPIDSPATNINSDFKRVRTVNMQFGEQIYTCERLLSEQSSGLSSFQIDVTRFGEDSPDTNPPRIMHSTLQSPEDILEQYKLGQPD